MRFWDASAVAPLLIDEGASATVARLLADDGEVVAWWGSRVECTSAIRRRERDGSLDSDAARQALALLGELSEAWAEMQPTDAVRARAERALALHPLRAADAFQLAAALAWGSVDPSASELVCLDERLRDAALREGLAVLP